MKKYIKKLIMLFVIFMFVIPVYSQQITLEEAQTAATSALLSGNRVNEQNITLQTLPVQKISVEKINNYSAKDTTFMYEVVFNNGEGVLLSGNKNCLPVLGYLGDTKMSVFDKNAPCGLTALLEGYTEQIRASFIEQKENVENVEKWDSLFANKINNAPPYIVVAPLLKSKWGQDVSNGYGATILGNILLYVVGDCEAYNYYIADKNCNNSYCDIDVQNRSKKPPAGCGAIAMSQIMYYWKYPKTYDWCNMRDSLATAYTENCRWENRPGEHGGYGTYWVCDSTPNPNYIQERNAVASLIKDCAGAIETSYGCDASGSYETDIALALNRRGYSHALSLVDPQIWTQRVKNNLDAGRPLIFTAFGGKSEEKAGHHFVCDGYMSNNYFHFNWGWKGRGEDNSWFALTAIRDWPAINNKFIYSIYPDKDFDYCNNDTTITKTTQDIPKYPTNLTVNFGNTTYNTIASGQNVTYMAHNSIIIKPGFRAASGSKFRAYIEPCESCTHPQLAPPVNHAPSAQYEEEYQNGDSYEVNFVTPKIFVYPNPTTGIVNIVCENTEIKAVSVFDVLGRMLQNNSSFSGDILDLSYLSNGVYFVKIKTSSDQTTHKIVIEK